MGLHTGLGRKEAGSAEGSPSRGQAFTEPHQKVFQQRLCVATPVVALPGSVWKAGNSLIPWSKESLTSLHLLQGRKGTSGGEILGFLNIKALDEKTKALQLSLSR